MSHFYSRIQGNRGEATRCGSKASGITAWAQSWTARATTYMRHYNGEDHLEVALGDGPSGYTGQRLRLDLGNPTAILKALADGDSHAEELRDALEKAARDLGSYCTDRAEVMA